MIAFRVIFTLIYLGGFWATSISMSSFCNEEKKEECKVAAIIAGGFWPFFLAAKEVGIELKRVGIGVSKK